ncbi:F-box protein SKIP22-like [Diospyros lotus]|uniref:F-box protein SKIP22-like n=1 Tax=Diospyros lotus TaxID=55363 RepID=UPI0022549997|nr:F-box protein SKIP22-like [Diospyros lotus]
MKLRLRPLETKETLKFDVPPTCSIQELKDLISQAVSSSPASVHLSLNRKHELSASSSHDALESLGICSGDLIYFTLNPNAFALVMQNVQSNSNHQASVSQEIVTLEPNSQKEQALVSNTQKEETLDFDSGMSGTIPDEDRTQDLNSQIEENLDMDGTESMDVDDDASMRDSGKSFSVPCFLRKVFSKEVGEGGGGDHKLLAIAVHAVLLESGFVGFNSITRTKVEGFHLPDEWPSSAFTISLWYTLPEIADGAVDGVETVVLKFQSLGKFLNIYGSLAKTGCRVYRVCLDEERLSLCLNLMWARIDEGDGKNRVSGLHPKNEVFEFWKIVKDRLALPLLIDLCDKAGLDPPPCFMRLPTDLKLKILESLPGADVAKLECVCSELCNLSSNDDLWKQKFIERFGDAEGSQGGSNWKEKFEKSTRKRRRTEVSTGWRFMRREPFPRMVPPRIIRDPYPFLGPRVIGGEYDIVPFPLGRNVRTGPRRNVIPHGNIGARRA